MNDEAAEVKKLLAPLRDRPVSLLDTERLTARRARVVAALKDENRRLYSVRARRRVLGVGLAASLSVAALVCAFLGVRHWSHPSVSAEAELTLLSGDMTGTSGRVLRQGDHVSTSESEVQTPEHRSAELKSTSGLDLRVAEATHLSVAGILGRAKSNHVDLRQGEVTCRVPHLAEGERFSVVTPDARVVVHGTVFSVRFDPALSAESKTCVRVTQGVVIVHHGSQETALNAGDSWGCSQPPVALGNTSPTPAADGREASAREPSPALPRGSAHAAAVHSPKDSLGRSTLAEENQLLQAALAAERVGNREQARTMLQSLLTEYPGSPLSQVATRALARVSATQ